MRISVIIDHGVFSQYAPDTVAPALATSQVLFCRNERGIDWYDLQRTIEPGAALIEVDPDTGALMGWTGETGAHDYSTRWPLEKRLLEIRPAASVAGLTVSHVYRDGIIALVEPVEPVPAITPRQLRLWLLSRGLLAQVPTLIDAMPEPDKSVAQIEWEFATVFEHNNPLVSALGSAVGLSADDIETGFREAALL